MSLVTTSLRDRLDFAVCDAVDVPEWITPQTRLRFERIPTEETR